MSKLFTTLTAIIIATAAGAAGYVYFTGDCCQESLTPPSATSTGSFGEDEECPLCAAAKKKSCCSGESLAKFAAMNAKPAAPACCSEGAESQVAATSSVVGGLAFACSISAPADCCSEGESLGITALVGTAAVAAK